MPGNRFYNGILFGLAEVLAMIVSNFLLIYLYDITAFRLVFTMSVLCYITLIFCEGWSPLLDHVATFMIILCIGGWLNVNLLIMELRVPPQNVAAVQLMTRTLSMAFGILSPTIASFKAPYPYLILLGLAVLGFLASTALPVPGHHLPKVTETKNSLVKIVEQGSDKPTLLHNLDEAHILEPTPLIHHSMSHAESFTERRM